MTTRAFAFTIGWAFIILGMLNFFAVPLMIHPLHGLFHILVGVLGVGFSRENHEGYTLWIGMSSLALAILGFFDLTRLVGIYGLPSLFNWVYLIIGVGGIATYASVKEAAMQVLQSSDSGLQARV